jgi:hypothetical protein
MFFLGTIALCFAASGAFAADVFSGNWKVNVAKSKYDPGPPPKGPNFSKIDAIPGGLKFTNDGVNAEGDPTHIEPAAFALRPLHTLADQVSLEFMVAEMRPVRVDVIAAIRPVGLRHQIGADLVPVRVDPVERRGIDGDTAPLLAGQRPLELATEQRVR